jgi:hypothetical protein
MLGKKSRNAIPLYFGFALLAVSGYYFFRGLIPEEIQGVKDIGLVFKKDNELRRKSATSLTWIGIENSSKIYPGDKIFTGTQSLAQLNLFDLAEVGMSASTLLKVDAEDGKSLGLESGHGLFNAKLSKNLTKATVKAAGKTMELSGTGTEIQVNSNEKKTMVTALSGSVSYQTVGANGKLEKKTLTPNQILGIDKKGVTTVVSIPVKLIVPSVSEEILAVDGQAVVFKWKVLSPGSTLIFELSKTPSFDQSFHKSTVTGLSETSVKIESKHFGMIYWRVIDPAKSEYFHSQQFEYQPLAMPVVYRPAARETVPLPMPKNLQFSWEKRFDFNYEGEIQQLDGSKTGTQKFNTSAVSYQPKGLTAGHYQFRIRAIKRKLISEWSPWAPFTVGDGDRKPVELVSPADQYVARLSFQQKKIDFKWNGGGVQSMILIAKDPEFKTVLVESITNRNAYEWSPEKSGTYFWYVKADPKEKIGKYRSFSVQEPRLTLKSPRDDLQFIYETDGYQEVKFEWAPASFTGKYIFEYSTTPDFRNVIESVDLDRTEHVVSFKRVPQLYYWRVKTPSQVTAARTILFKPLPRLPTIAVKNLQVKIQEDKTVLGGARDKNRKQGATGFIEMLIPQIANVATYQIDILRDQDPSSVLFSKTLKSPLFRWTNPVPGEYHYRLSYTDPKGKRSPGSEIARLVVLPMDPPKVIAQPKPTPVRDEDRVPTY